MQTAVPVVTKIIFCNHTHSSMMNPIDLDSELPQLLRTHWVAIHMFQSSRLHVYQWCLRMQTNRLTQTGYKPTDCAATQQVIHVACTHTNTRTHTNKQTHTLCNTQRVRITKDQRIRPTR